MNPKFLTFEGGEGAGKSTQVKLLAEFLRGEGTEVIVTREPGGTKAAEEIRKLLLSKTEYSPMAEVLLNFAARVDHVEKIIKPALAAGKFVLCDRFFDSTYAYQQAAGREFIDKIRAATLGNFAPAKTFILDIDAGEALERAQTRGETNRFEEMGLDFHQKIRTAFLEIAKQNPKRCIIIDAAQTPEKVQQEIQNEIRKIL